jgi:hypothetical protein
MTDPERGPAPRFRPTGLRTPLHRPGPPSGTPRRNRLTRPTRPTLRTARLRTRRRLARLGAALRTRTARLLLPVLAALLAVPLLTAAHQARPAPYGDRLSTPGRAAAPATPDPAVRIRGPEVHAYDRTTGRTRWTYTRTGHLPLTVHAAPGHLFALWSDGLVTDTVRGDGRAVRWHRAIPAFDGRPAGVLQPLDPASEMLAVLTPHHIAAYRTVDGDLRWVLPAKPGCRFVPARAVRRGHVLLVAQPCGGAAAWTEQIVPVDALGRISPGRNPLGNGRTTHDQQGGAPDPRDR